MSFSRCAEEALVHAVAEARRAAPAVLFLPHLHLWWDTAAPQLRSVLEALLADIPPNLPLLLLASAGVPADELDPAARALFGDDQVSPGVDQTMDSNGQCSPFSVALVTIDVYGCAPSFLARERSQTHLSAQMA